jgi:hypothetical protein
MKTAPATTSPLREPPNLQPEQPVPFLKSRANVR